MPGKERIGQSGPKRWVVKLLELDWGCQPVAILYSSAAGRILLQFIARQCNKPRCRSLARRTHTQQKGRQSGPRRHPLLVCEAKSVRRTV